MTVPKDLDPYIIGLWRFHEAGKPRLWCITYRWRGCYYDVSGCQTLDDAFIVMRAALSKLRGKRR
jgi:hypothetical protein